MQYVNLPAMRQAFSGFHGAPPFDHCVVDDFLLPDVLNSIEDEFLAFDSERWFCYKNALEDKKALNDWNAFPKGTYSLFTYLNSPEFTAELSELVGTQLYADSGLHGGGWHVHGPGGNLNPHLDYSIHPKLGLQRRINIIIYVARALSPEHGGHLGLWGCDLAESGPGELVQEIEPRFNRAVIFDTTQNSWHGMSRPLGDVPGLQRRSLAIYYLCHPSEAADPRGRALYAPRAAQKGNAEIEELIRLRAGVSTSEQVYKK